MSLTVLKNKSRRYKATVSGRDKGGFSIVGGHRNQGWIGQDNLGRHLIRTPFRGNEPLGHGGCDGKYVRSIISNSGIYCTNDPNVIKRSTMNTAGLLLTAVKYPTGIFHNDCDNIRCRGNWVKDFEPLNHSQSGFIKRIKVSAACEDKNRCYGKKEKAVLEPADCECLVKSSFIGGKKKYAARITKRKLVNGAISMSEYIDVGLLKKNDLPTPANKKAFPMTLNHNGCDTNYKTPEEAIDDGELPVDWMQKKKYSTNNLTKNEVKNQNNILDIYNQPMLLPFSKEEKNTDTRNKFSDDLVDFGAFEHFITYDYDVKSPYKSALDQELPDDWLKNTAHTDIIYSVNPYL